ncbi:MAG: CPBP family intramembrane metalloprotease [Sphingomonadaceae bacterium]|nr:CPBP family intramembrane metalloprotease [Sphingomonadaceae bacterium]
MSQETAVRRDIFLTLIGFGILWVLLDRSAAAAGSLRGEMGLQIGALVVGAAWALEWVLSRRRPAEAYRAIGMALPARRPLLVAIVLCGALILYFPVFAAVSGARITVMGGAAMLALGMFAQGGVAEEVVFRGFLFRRLRAGRSFWRAAWIAAIPFVAVHALLFLSLDFPIALASLLLALSLSFPLSWIFEVSGNSIWPPAIIHATLQAAPKLVDAGEDFTLLAMGWIVLGGVVPWALFLLRPTKPSEDDAPRAPGGHSTRKATT